MSGCLSGLLRLGAIIGSFILTVWLTFTILDFIHARNPGLYPFDWHPGDTIYCPQGCTSNYWLSHIGIGFLVSFLVAIACAAASGFLILFSLEAIFRTTKATKWKHPAVIVALTLGGSILAGIGFLLPWVTITFAPPGGSLVLAGVRRYAFTTIFNGFYSPYFSIPLFNSLGSAHLLQITILIVFFFGLYSLVELFPDSQPRERILKRIKDWAKSRQAAIPESIVDFVQTLAHILQSLAWIVIIWFVFTLAKLTYQTSAGTDAPVPYATITVGVGLGLMFIGFVLSGIGIYNKITVRLAKDAVKMLGTSRGIKIALFLERVAKGIIEASLVILPILGSLAYAYLVLLPLLLMSLGFRFEY